MEVKTELELMYFLDKISQFKVLYGLEIPSNITFEIDSKEIQNEIEENFKKVHSIKDNESKMTFVRGQFMGTKICFK